MILRKILNQIAMPSIYPLVLAVTFLLLNAQEQYESKNIIETATIYYYCAVIMSFVWIYGLFTEINISKNIKKTCNLYNIDIIE